MKMCNVMRLIMFMAAVLLIAGCTSKSSPGQNEPAGHAQDDTARQDILYTCNCGPQCECATVSTKPGKCACGAPLKWGHVLKIEGSVVVLCQCQEGCRCYGVDNRQYYCNCGVPVKRVDLKGKDIYFCNCGGSCYCNTVSDSPAKCRCGIDLKKVD